MWRTRSMAAVPSSFCKQNGRDLPSGGGECVCVCVGGGGGGAG